MLYGKICNKKMDAYLKVNKVLSYTKTQFNEVLIAIIESFGKCLIINNHLETSFVEYIPYHESLIPKFKPFEDQKVLLLGCGTGIAINTLISRGWKNITALDRDHQLIELCAAHFSDFNNNIYNKQDLFTLKIEDALTYLKSTDEECYDYVILDISSPEIIAKKEEYISEIHRILTKNGLFSFNDYNKYDMSYFANDVLKYFTRFKPRYQTILDYRLGHIQK